VLIVAWKEAAIETEPRATVHWPRDEERFADLDVFFVHTPGCIGHPAHRSGLLP
jgi:hypothetical protein